MAQAWRNAAGELHRDDDDKPARIWDRNLQEWWINGRLHRDGDKPAVLWADGSMEWWTENRRHRGNLKPAIISTSGLQSWCVDGIYTRSVMTPSTDERFLRFRFMVVCVM